MIFGGKWTNQDKPHLGAYINFISKKKAKALVKMKLVSNDNLLLTTQDGYTLVVKGYKE